MKPTAQIILLLILYNIKPRSHLSSIPLEATYILFFIPKNRQVNVARIIANEIKMVAESSRKPGVKPICHLVFTVLIMGLCVARQIVLLKQVHENIYGTINSIYVSR